jgi:esterase/lipase
MGHSMGGLLAADAATDISVKGRRRIVAIIAFDTPFLGMHPHVIISGIASLLPKNNKTAGKANTEKEMNDERQVEIVNDKVTDDWESFKEEAIRTCINIFCSYSIITF